MKNIYKPFAAFVMTASSSLICTLNAAPVTGTAGYETQTISFTKKDETSPLGYWETHIEYPELSGSSESIRAINAAIAKTAAEYQCDENNGDKEFHAEITLLNKQLISLRFSDSWYCAGMPNTQGRTGTMTYSLIDGQQIEIERETEQWNGVYKYTAILGENAADDKVIIEYELVLNEADCKLTVQGYQTNETLLCTIEKDGVNLTIRFKSYVDGSTENIYGVAVYTPHSILFQLTSTPDTLVTIWGTLTPDDNYSSGKYFTKKL